MKSLGTSLFAAVALVALAHGTAVVAAATATKNPKATTSFIVGAQLTAAQAATLSQDTHLNLFADTPVKTQSIGAVPDVYQRAMMGVSDLAAQGINGSGVTVAVLDSGVYQTTGWTYTMRDLNGRNRMMAQYDAINNVLVDATHACPRFPCIKPDLVAPGGHLSAYMDLPTQRLPRSYPQFTTAQYDMFQMSGTSQAAAVTSGVVALMLQANPLIRCSSRAPAESTPMRRCTVRLLTAPTRA